ncbi:SpoIIE family protein phosphatase [Desulfatibacillum aliphaticivorans]|uniref:SpoIIE family protein phosphatase n=1 Tax=Desulfatibacillum aliphaticivorans TaxID=218208 RepID=UPI0003F91D12|nr:SpoIIE family protein phosphatase [Desulfatibacillum aliphaticivorans]
MLAENSVKNAGAPRRKNTFNRFADRLSEVSLGVKLNLILLAVGLAPALAGLLFLHQGRPEQFHSALALYITGFVIFIYPFSKAVEELLVLRQTRRINNYVDEVKAGRPAAPPNLPDEEGDEHDFIRLQRNIYWMVQGLVTREAKLEKVLQNLDRTRRQILESIEYASLIQQSFLPSARKLEKALGDYFLLWAPRDGVGGDAYWVRSAGGFSILAVIDCTGHGVPGAFLTLIANSLFEQNYDESCNTDPARLLTRMDRSIRQSLAQHKPESLSNDGMEGGVCCIDWNNRLLHYSGARGRLLLSGPNGLHEIVGVKRGVGFANEKTGRAFINHAAPLDEADAVYLYTDGITDQAGGAKGLPFGRTRLRQLMKENQTLSMDGQKASLEQAFREYQGRMDQRDDVTVLGFSTRGRSC